MMPRLQVFAKDGAPGENRTPNLLVRSQALYPIELRAHRGRIASSDYNGNRIVSPNLITGAPAEKLWPGLDLRFPNPRQNQHGLWKSAARPSEGFVN
jgi:hypothetical protein